MDNKNIMVGISAFSFLLQCLPTAEAQTNSWQQTNGPFAGRVDAIAISPSSEMFVGVSYEGIFRSSSNGDKWFTTGAGPGYSGLSLVDDLAVNDSGVIFAGSNGFTGGGVYRSTDNGMTWDHVLRDLVVWCVKSSPTGTIFVGTFGYGFFRSTDAGMTWTQPISSGWGISVATNSKGTILFAGGNSGIYRSMDDGISWVLVRQGGALSMVVDKEGFIFAAAGTEGLYRSTDNGTSWQFLGKGMRGSPWVLALDSTGRVFCGDDNYVYVTSDDGTTWDVSLVTQGLIRSLAVNEHGQVFAGSERGIFRSNDRGITWRMVHTNLGRWGVNSLAEGILGSTFTATDYGLFSTKDNGATWERRFDAEVEDFAKTSRHHFFCVSSRAIYRSTNNGNQWTTIEPPGKPYLYSIKINGRDEIFIGVDGGVLKSTDNGTTWTRWSYPDSFTKLAINARGHLFAGGHFTRAVFLSTDNGIAWTGGPTIGSVMSLVPDSKDRMFAGTYSNGLFCSTDNGASWNKTGLTEGTVQALAINESGHIFANNAKDLGILVSTDDGRTWSKAGLDSIYVTCLGLGANGVLFAGTDMGVFRSTMGSISAIAETSRIPSVFVLEQNYPNPFNPATTIRFSLPYEEHVGLRIFNLLGEEVATLISGTLRAGAHSIQWNATGVPSGMYFYRLQAEDFSATKKLILLK